jgi:GPH family glycoside/pentoside/hexuronide:cation symporter
MSKSTTAKQDKVPFWEKFSLGIGSLTSFFGLDAVSRMAYPVYNMLLHVSPAKIGIALMLPRIWDAISDPLMGRISDNHHSRLGRRRPFIIAGALAMGTIFTFVWTAPEGFSENLKMTYFVVMQLLFFTAYTVFVVPYNALTYEMTPDYNERTRIMSFAGFFWKVGELLCGWVIPIAAPLGVMIIGAKAVKDGEPVLTMPGIIFAAALVGLIIMGLCGILPGLAVKERFKRKTEVQEKVKVLEGFKGAFTSRAFNILIAVVFLNTLAGLLASGIDQFLLVYYMNAGDKIAGLAQKAMLTSGYAVVGFAFIPVITWLGTQFGKKISLYVVYTMMLVGSIAKWWIFTPGHTIYTIAGIPFDPVLMIDPLMCGPMWVAVKIMLASMMADICDEDELKHGQRREGMFGAVFSWTEKLVASIAVASSGFVLVFAGFDAALEGNQAPETIHIIRLFLAGGPASAALLAILALIFYPITAKRAAETRRKLEERRSESHAEKIPHKK